MSRFETLSGKSGITGIAEFSQSMQKRMMRIYSIGGYCRGAVTQWLASKKKSGFKALDVFANDEEEKKSEKSSLFSSKEKFTLKGMSSQVSYNESSSDIDVTAKELSGAGLTHQTSEDKTDDEGFKKSALVIAEHVSSVKSKYFILSLRGDTNHAVGIVRDDDTFRFFDPNVGEFEVPGKIGMLAMLVFLEAVCYSGKYASSYYVYAFKG